MHDPSIKRDVTELRYHHMALPPAVVGNKRKREIVIELLSELETALRENNTYVHDLLTAAQISQEEGDRVLDAQFVIDPTARPRDEHERRYNAYEFDEVSVILLDDSGRTQRPAGIQIRWGDGKLHEIHEMHRARLTRCISCYSSRVVMTAGILVFTSVRWARLPMLADQFGTPRKASGALLRRRHLPL